MNWDELPPFAWSSGVVAVLLLALVGYLRKYFTPREETQRIEKKIDNLCTLIEKSQEKQERTYATTQELNGMGRRVDELRERIEEATTEARSAFNLATASRSSVDHLTQRLEDVLNRGLEELKEEVKELARAARNRPYKE